MKPLPLGTSNCAIAVSTFGENLSGLLSCVTITVMSARTWRFALARAASRSIEAVRCFAHQLAQLAHQLGRQAAANLDVAETCALEQRAHELVVRR
jgi:hypothetical protein